jgi:hypothetical protein
MQDSFQKENLQRWLGIINCYLRRFFYQLIIKKLNIINDKGLLLSLKDAGFLKVIDTNFRITLILIQL